MVRSRQTPKQHEHCAKCFNAHCQAPVKVTVSCPVVKCRKGCGAVLHMCKEEEHGLLCRNEKVPCLNVRYGCPFTMPRHRLAKHLEVCPASVVCCSQEWIRWPVSGDTDAAFYRNVSGGDPRGGEGDLDVAMALRDQQQLFGSIKMKNIFPELIEEFEGPPRHAIAVGGASCEDEGASGSGCSECAGNAHALVRKDGELSQEERDAIAKSTDVKNMIKYSSWEGMFRKEIQGCEEGVKNLDKQTVHVGVKEKNDSSVSQEEIRDSNLRQESVVDVDAAAGTAPWQEGVLAKMREEATLREYNSYLVHNGPLLIHFGQLPACTPREMDFVYGGLEPIEVQTVRTFKIPTSYRAKRNHLKDPSVKVKTERQSVDTSDLGVPTEELPKSDDVSATLLCALEKELKGHLISETSGTDGFYVDVGTQTYEFASAPFRADASLADVVVDRPGGLHMCVQMESVTRRHNKTNSAFRRDCGRFFRRDEYRSHFKNVHSDIQAGLDGWFQQRCPLAYLGCTYSQSRFRPCRQQATVRYCTDLCTFALRPAVPLSLHRGGDTHSDAGRGESARNADCLAGLPFEILQHIASYLDSYTLCQLSRVSLLFRELCSGLLQQRGMVSLKWEKKTYSHGGTSWRCLQKVWEFSCGFSSVDRWCFNDDVPSMSEHLKVCSFYERDARAEPVALPTEDTSVTPMGASLVHGGTPRSTPHHS